MRKLGVYVGTAILLSILGAGFLAYFVFSFNTDTQQWFDGLGRSLTDSPWLMRLILGEDRQWAGWFWFLVDMVVFWGGIAIALALIHRGSQTGKK